MSKFRGHKTGFMPTGANDCTPHFDGQTTKWRGFSGMPEGKLKVPEGLASVNIGNRRLAKAVVGAGNDSTEYVKGTNAFTRGVRRHK
jgi:hypothetical protein